ncbi:glycerol-3-phosphate dehydrogenase [Saccharothrix coeruleofusca]|uniref:Glycerol-3-phosphate dehydrogenase n=1 Tax=Saccharothrix coeruleofusca TaxID=33919 RepID=A0A918EG20_9PSEU|nr:glycerol-3-phosphate dehydrogenase [Saccharothrix coeruleofusca]MBP2337511.1 glycerol-3-phosphate dehydrogenase [Saccharothrix coeruleofusca]GGP65270.1 glycerol-3-phosphate dehydrogenase [Saccharothrix coeruleofusca]
MFARLDSARRADALRSIDSAEFDVLVVGGGVVGAGAALDAASRGLSVALVEAHDWAAGTSSRSSKLVHGGLRYLEQLEFKLVREALKERGLLLRRLAPHLVRPVPFLFPLEKQWERAYVGAGVLLYDSIGGAGAVPMHRHLSRRRMAEVGPSLNASAFAGAIRYYDAQMDDARLVMTLVRTAAQHGATVLSRARVTSLLRSEGAVRGARVEVDGQTVDVRARRVISATGVWTDSLNSMSSAPAPFNVRMSKGVHVLVPRERIQLDGGLITRTEKSVLFVIPWGAYWIVGTTDTPYDGDPAAVSASDEDVAYILDHVNAVLRSPLTVDDVVGTYAGLRPLLDGASGDTAKLSREHAVAQPEPGFFVIAGGKYTTYRVMAADVVDAAVSGLGQAVAPSLTARLPLCGAVGYHELWADRARVAAESGLPTSTVERLLGRYGSAVSDVLALAAQDPALKAEVAGYLAAEIVYAVTHEGALDLEDVLHRRTRIAVEHLDQGASVADQVADLIAGPLRWSVADRDAAVQAYRASTKMVAR